MKGARASTRIASRVILCCVLALVAIFPRARAQSGDVRIDISSGANRIPLLLESLQSAGDKSARETSVIADTILAHDLESSAVFEVTRSWTGVTPPDNAQAVVGGMWMVNGGEVVLHGEVHDLPARRSIFARDYRGAFADRRRLVHQFADDVVMQFTGEPGVAQTRIAFCSPAGRDKELFVMDFDGENVVPMTHDRSIALSPAFSSDGSLVLFTSYRGGGGPQIFVMPVGGGRPYLVSGRPGINTSASYSPDGREIVCTLSYEGNPEVYALDARGGTPRRLTNNRGIDTSPAWSPTGREIAFTSDRGGTFNVYVMDREGGNVRRLTYEVSGTDSPAWSPKGDRIAFVSRTSDGFDIYVCRADGSGPHRVVSGRSNENPKWSPDGRQLVFASNRDGAFGLWVTDLSDRPPRRLETGGKMALSPAWSPRITAPTSSTNTSR